MDSSSFTSSSVNIESNYSTIEKIEYLSNEKVLKIKPLHSFASLDTISRGPWRWAGVGCW